MTPWDHNNNILKVLSFSFVTMSVHGILIRKKTNGEHKKDNQINPHDRKYMLCHALIMLSVEYNVEWLSSYKLWILSGESCLVCVILCSRDVRRVVVGLYQVEVC